MKAGYDMSPTELAMRVCLRVQTVSRHREDFLMSDLVQSLVDDLGVSRPTAFRYMRIAIDVLGIPYDGDQKRSARKGSITRAALLRSRAGAA